MSLKSESKTKPVNECPKCNFIKSDKFPNGYAMESIGVRHCPDCGYWDAIALKKWHEKIEAKK